MLTYMLDTNICIHVMKTYPPAVREKFNALAELDFVRFGQVHIQKRLLVAMWLSA